MSNALVDTEFPRIERSTVSEQAMAGLLDLIRRGVLKPGDQLPPQRQLVTKMGLSRTGVREALRGLASMGVIEIQHGRGAFVRKITPELLVDPESIAALLERESLLHAIEVRRILEIDAIGLAAERATQEDIDELGGILKQMEKARQLRNNPLRYSPHFHLAIAKATHNPVLSSVVRPFISLIARAVERIAQRVPEARNREFSQHVALYKAVKNRDIEEARCLMRQHLEAAERDIVAAFSASAIPKAKANE